MEAPEGGKQNTDGEWRRDQYGRKCSFNIRVKNAEQRAGIPGMRQRRIEAPSEVDQSTVVNGAVARRSRLQV
ncbi:hypothetical protein EEI76_22350 (plasmid) [Enterobacter cloacae]|nr:hypothetical protein EEI76_22350 [Enterobacter cloacae]